MEFYKPLGRDPDKPIGSKKEMDGVAGLLEKLKQEEAENADQIETDDKSTDTEYQKFLNRVELRKATKEEIKKRNTAESFEPNEDPNAEGDPYKSLFISKLSKEATEEDLRREFAMYGHIEKLRIVRDVRTGKSKGYAFILYEREKDMKGTSHSVYAVSNLIYSLQLHTRTQKASKF